MFSPKVYVLVCHGCGAFHEMKAEFLAAPMSMRFPCPPTDDGKEREWSVPALGCPDCMKAPRDANGENPIGRAFKHGMTPEAAARAQREFAETWRSKLEARKAARA